MITSLTSTVRHDVAAPTSHDVDKVRYREGEGASCTRTVIDHHTEKRPVTLSEKEVLHHCSSVRVTVRVAAGVSYRRTTKTQILGSSRGPNPRPTAADLMSELDL
ncbi:hypothetical protein Q8A73_020802 [Channa argus]|nr:hypothetical protein Q8A73_020802 [Channa argus]